MPVSLEHARSLITAQMGSRQLYCGVVLGSGLGKLAEKFRTIAEWNYRDLPGLPEVSVAGHDGVVQLVEIDERNAAVFFKGRFHGYEGHSAHTTTLPVQLMHLLKAKVCILTNAAGGMGDHLNAGDLAIIKDHINMTGMNPLTGPNDAKLGPRFPDQTSSWTAAHRELLKQVAIKNKIELKEGVYAGVIGPSYETPAEVRMLKVLGADMVGMSTVHEAVMARYLGMELIGVSLVSNLAASENHAPLDHADVQEVAEAAQDRLQTLIYQTLMTLVKVG